MMRPSELENQKRFKLYKALFLLWLLTELPWLLFTFHVIVARRTQPLSLCIYIYTQMPFKSVDNTLIFDILVSVETRVLKVMHVSQNSPAQDVLPL